MKKIICFLFFVFGAIHLFSQKLGRLEYLYSSAVKIQTSNAEKKTEDASGFFFSFQTDKGFVPAIITNAHILANATTVSFFFLEADKAGRPLYGKQQKITLNKSDLPIVFHPENNVDLAMIPINPILAYLVKQKINISYHSMDESLIPTDSVANEVNMTEELFMIGFPAALQKELNGLPLVKKGITATPFFLDYDNKKEFLAELSVFDGSGGAPVFIQQADKSTRFDVRMSGERVFLAGINAATYTKGFLQKDFIGGGNIPTNNENISIIIKSSKLLDFKKILNGLKK